MGVINNKDDIKELAVKFKNELKSQNADYLFFDPIKVGTIIWWELFKKYRAVYFMVMVNAGMYYAIAWKYAKTQTKDEVIKTLIGYGWHLTAPVPHVHKFDFQYRSGNIFDGKNEVGKCKCGEWAVRKYGKSEWKIIEN